MSNPKTKKKKRLGSYPFVSVLFSITLALFVIGLFGVILIFANQITSYFKENIEMQVYLNSNVSENDKIRINKTLATKDYIFTKNNKPLITFISKGDAAKELIGDTKENFLEILDNNPLKDTYIIKVSPEFQEEVKLDDVKTDIEKIPGVFEASFSKSIVSSLNKNVKTISYVLLGIAVLLLLTTAILINNTIKLALFSQRFLIRSMQLVGGTSGFIRKPFLTKGTMHGMVSGILASILLFFILQLGFERIEELKMLHDNEKMLILFVILVIFGGLVGFFSTLRAINKYLKLSLDELY